MKLPIKILLCLILIPIISIGQSDCQHKASVRISTLNFASGCPFGDSGGIDPVLEILNPDGSQLYVMHLSNLNQVTGPVQNLVLDFSDGGNPNTCPAGNFSARFCLGPQPIDDTEAVFTVRIYEKSSNFFNNDCSGYNGFFDSNLGESSFTFDFTQPTGTIDVGSCISFNYDLTLEFTGSIEEEIVGPLCPESNLLLNGTIYDVDNPIGQFIKPGISSCDTVVDINLSFLTVPDIEQFGNLTICPGSPHNIGVDNADDYVSFLWSTGETTGSIVITEPGDYSVIATTSDACSKESTFTIDTFDVLQIVIVSEDAICENSLLDLTVSGNPTQVIWDDNSTDDTRIISEAGTYSVTITDANGCTTVATKTIELNSAPTITFVGDQVICRGDTATISTLENHSTYLWNDLTEDENLMVTEPGVYTVTVTNNNDCSSSASYMVSVLNSPAPMLLGVQDFCFGETITVTTTEIYASYLWSNGSTDSQFLIEEGGAYTLQVTDQNGCTGMTTAIVTENVELTPTISGDLNFCEGDTGLLSVDQNYSTILWDNGSDLQSIQVDATGTYTVTVSDNAGCTAVAQADVIVADELEPELTGGMVICEGGSLTLGLNAIFASQIWSDNSTDAELAISSAGTYSVTVEDNNGCTGSTAINITETSTIETQIEVLTCDSTELGTLVIPLISQAGCDSLVTQNTLFDPQCIIMYSINTTETSCAEASDGSITLTFTQGLSSFEIFLLFNGEILESVNSLNGNSTITFDGLEAGNYQLIFPSQETANLELTIGVDMNTIDVPEQVVILEGSSTTLQANITNLNPNNFSWWQGDSTLCASNCLEVSVAPLVTTTYTFIATTEQGCIWRDSTRVIVNATAETNQIYIPNVFNPNAGGEDSTFRIFSNSTSAIQQLSIYDRWGNLIFEGDQDASWDGNFGNQPSEAGVYVYKLTFIDDNSGESIQDTGTFLLIR